MKRDDTSITHVTFADRLPGANLCASILHRALGQVPLHSKMIVARRLSQDTSIIEIGRITSRASFAADLLPKRLFYAAPQWAQTSLAPESALAWTGLRAANAVHSTSPDVVHLHWICGGLVRIESLRSLARYPLIWTMYDMWAFAGAEHYTEQTRYIEGYTTANRPPGERGFDATRWVWERKRKTYRDLPRLTLVSPSRWLAEEAAKSALLRDRRIELIHNGVDLEIFRPTPTKAARAALDLPPDAPIILFGAATGTASPRKGFDLLIAALKALSTERWDDPPHVVTFGSHPGDSSAPLPFDVTNLGHIEAQDRLALVYSAADVFVAPSRQENLATTVLESLACGTPVVAFDIGGMPDSIDHMRNGYLASPFDIEDLATGIFRILRADPRTTRSLARNAREVAEERFDIIKQAHRHIELYEEVIEERQSEASSSSR